MKSTAKSVVWVFGISVLALGCGDDGGTGGSGGGSGGSGGGSGGSGGAGGGGSNACEATCPTIAPDGTSAKSVVIESIDFGTGEVVLRNTTTSAVDTTDWQYCMGPETSYGALAVANDEIPASSTVTIAVPVDDPIPVNNLSSNGELGIYRGENFDGTSANNQMEAYVQWDSADDEREIVAVDADLWTAGMSVPLCENPGGDVALVAIGDVTTAAGWTATRADCL